MLPLSVCFSIGMVFLIVLYGVVPALAASKVHKSSCPSQSVLSHSTVTFNSGDHLLGYAAQQTTPLIPYRPTEEPPALSMEKDCIPSPVWFTPVIDPISWSLQADNALRANRRKIATDILFICFDFIVNCFLICCCLRKLFPNFIGPSVNQLAKTGPFFFYCFPCFSQRRVIIKFVLCG